MAPKSGRVTQKTIAELAGVSQAVVSLVLTGRTDSTTRISEETRSRVLDVIRSTGYSADPVARVMAGKANNLFGVFTYESAFPTDASDFYAPLLRGVEAAAEDLGVDLLLFTSARSEGGRRRLLQESARLRMADGCVLLGREMDNDELSRLVESGYRFVAVGRRDGDERVPYVGADYATAVGELVARAHALGHRRFAYVRLDYRAESTTDRLRGFTQALAGMGSAPEVATRPATGLAALWPRLRDSAASVVFVEDPADAVALDAVAGRDGRDGLSVVALGEVAGGAASGVAHLVAPRSDLGARAVRLLAELLAGHPGPPPEHRLLLPCDVVGGGSLRPAPQ
ncbi:LacI family DNA-binding transcriptional regulator [Tessaracoccus terricola]